MTDVWSGESFTRKDRLSFELSAHGSRLLAVSPADPDQFIDCDTRILRAEKQGKELKLFFDCANAAEFTFAPPAEVTLDGKKLSVNGSTVKADIREKSVMTVRCMINYHCSLLTCFTSWVVLGCGCGTSIII